MVKYQINHLLVANKFWFILIEFKFHDIFVLVYGASFLNFLKNFYDISS